VIIVHCVYYSSPITLIAARFLCLVPSLSFVAVVTKAH